MSVLTVCVSALSVLIVCVSTLYVCPDGLSDDHEKLNPVPGNEARMVCLGGNISPDQQNICVQNYSTLIQIFNFITDACPPNS